MIRALSQEFIGSGFVDIPVTFFSFLACAVLLPDLIAKRFVPSHIIVAGVLAAGAALTKQAGLYIILPLLIWTGVVVWGQKKNLLLAGKWAMGVFLIFGMLIAPWYGYKLLEIGQGHDDFESSSIEHALTKAIGERTLLGKWSYGVRCVTMRTSAQLLQSAHRTSLEQNKLISDRFQQPISDLSISLIALGLLVLLGLSFASAVSRLVTLTVTIPFFMVWATNYCYDFRNLTLALPFLGLALGCGIFQLMKLLFRPISSIKSGKHQQSAYATLVLNRDRLSSLVLAVLLAFTAVVAYWHIVYPAPVLYMIHEQKMRRVGVPAINEALYQYYTTNGLGGKIYTMYRPAAYLPELKDYSVIVNKSILSLELLKHYERNPDIRYVLWWEGTIDPDALAYMMEQVAQGKYTAIFNIVGCRFVEIKAK